MRLLILLFTLPLITIGQTFNTGSGSDGSVQLNTITTAVPFVLNPGDAMQFGLAEVGVVSSSFYHETAFTSNPALLANGRKYAAVRSNYTPWLRALAPDINLTTSSLAWGITERHSIGVYQKFFSLGNIQFTDNNGNFIRDFNPWEMQTQLNYATWFPNGISTGIAVKHIYSNLTGGLNVGGADTRPGQSVAFDLGIHHRRHRKLSEHFGLTHAVGFSLNNMGMKMSYTDTPEKDFIPTNMQLGIQIGISHLLGEHVRIEDDVSYQVTKLLVPTPPVYATDSSGYILDSNGNRVIEQGMDPNVSVPMGMIQSFYDAPGGTAEEWREVNHMLAHELRVVLFEKLAVHARQGFFYEHASKGDRQFLTLGGGVSFFGFRIDLAGFVPLTGQHPLRNTFSVSLGFRARLGEGKKLRLPSWRPELENLYPSDIDYAVEGEEEESTPAN